MGDNGAMSAPANNRVVILLGTNYSGSHLLSHLLSAHSACIGVGELHRYEHLLKGDENEPVAAEYGSSPLFAGLNELALEQWYDTLVQRATEQFGLAPVIIDNSKKVRWVKKIVDSPRMDLRLVHLLRDPRALVLRWLNTYDTNRRRRTQRLRVAKRVPTRASQILAGDWTNVFVYKWLRENRQITEFIAKNKYAHAMVTYHDMVFDTEPMLQRLMPLLGLDYEPGQLRFGESSQFGTTKKAHADAVQRSEIRPDLKWQTQLDPSAVQAVNANQDVTNYLEGLGLALGERGIVRRG